MKRIRKSLKKRSGKTILSLLLIASLAVGGMTTAFATERGSSADDASDIEDAASASASNSDYDSIYGLYGGYDGQDSMDDPDTAGACVGWDIETRSAITGESGLWWIDDYYVGESSPYDTEKTDDFSLKYQVEFHTSQYLGAEDVQIVIDASLGTYRNGNNIIPTDIGIPYGTPDDYTTSSSSPFNYYYFYYNYDNLDSEENPTEVILTASQAATCESEVYMKVWNYREIASGSNAMFQVLYKELDVMQIPDMTEWNLDIVASVDIGEEDNPNIEKVDGNTLSGLVDTAVTLTSVTKKAYTATDSSYTPELYTRSQVSSYINGSIPEPYASGFDDYIYIVWYVTLNGSATQAYEITVDENTFSDTAGNGSVVGYKVNTSTTATSKEVSYSYGTDTDGNPTLSFSSSTQRNFSAAFYVVTAYNADTYVTDTEIENDVTLTVHSVDGYDGNTTKSAFAVTTWGEYKWTYSGDIIGIEKWQKIVNSVHQKTGSFEGNRNLYEENSAKGVDTGEYPYSTKSTDRGYKYTHYIDNETGQIGEWIEGSYYKTTTVDDALYVYPNGGTDPSRMLTKDDYYFSSVKIQTDDYGYDVWEDKTTDPTDYDGVDQDVYIYAMYYNADEEAADDDGWEYVATVPFSTSGSMTYTFTSDDLARQPYRVKAVHSTADYATYCTITIGLTLRHDSPTIKWCYDYCDEKGIDLDTIKIENLSGVAGQTYGVPGYTDGYYFQDQNTDGDNYSEKDTETGETLTEFTEGLYGVILMRDNAYVTLTGLQETSASFKNVITENDTANERVLANYYLTSYEAYYVTGESTVTSLKDAGIYLPERHEVSYYDLLPYGMQFNPSTTVTAGRITSMNSTGSWMTNTGAWSKDGVTVKVDDDDVITNWNGTGRTMVIFHIYYDGDDASAFYDVPSSDYDLWYQGFAIYFQAYYDWADLESVDAEYNIAAYIAEGVTDETEQFMGQHDSTVWKDDGSANLSAQYEPFIGYSDLNGDGVTDLYTNMYASAQTSTNVAISSSDSIRKQVRADDDAFAEYGETAFVGNGRGYTYEVSLTNTYGATLSDIVLYDRLEYSVEDGRTAVETGADSVFNGLTEGEINNHWTGTFSSVSLTALTDVGIEPVVYYSANRNAPISENGDESGTEKTTPADVLTEANGWYTEERFIEVYGDLSEVKAVAVDISKTTTDKDYILDVGESISFQIHMIAPEDVEEGYLYAFNNPGYYSVSTSLTGGVTSSTDIGDTVRVELGEAGILEVEKEFAEGAEIPASMQNARFTFEITRKGEVLANQEYMIYVWDEEAGEEGNGAWIPTGVISATDAKGQFTLRAGQKAVFSKLVDLEDVEVTEVENVLWASGVDMDASKVESDNELYYTFTNSYRSPVYLYKTAMTTDLATEEELKNAEFTFQILVDTDGDGEYEPYANGEYLYVKEVLTDGSSPALDTSKGEAGHAYTDENGYVTLHIDDIIVFFPTDADGNHINVPYQIIEVTSGEKWNDDWVNMDDTAEGVTGDYGTSETITNYYKYRQLVVTKDLSDYNHDIDTCEDEWTFRLTDANGDAVTGNHWYMIDADGNPIEGKEGYLDENGEFTFVGAGSGRRVVVEGLVMGETYALTETDYDEELYEMVNDGTADVTMPTYSITRSVTITNEYLLRDLDVEKIVLSDDGGGANVDFTFVITKNGIALADTSYTVGDETYMTDSEGKFTLKSGQTAHFEDIGYDGDVIIVYEIQTESITVFDPGLESDHDYANNENKTWTYTLDGADGGVYVTFDDQTKVESNFDYIYIYDANNNEIGKYTGTTLAGATVYVPTATFSIKLTSDSSVTYWGFKVTCVSTVSPNDYDPSAAYKQIYPADGAGNEQVLDKDTQLALFINGDFDNVVSLTKNLVGLDEVGEAYVDLVKGDNTTATLVGEEEDIPYTVDVTFGVYDGGDCVTQDEGDLIDYVSGNSAYPYVYIKVNAAGGSYTVKSYNGGVMTEKLSPYDYIFIAEVGSCTVKASESADMERVLLDVTDSVAGGIGAGQILSEGDVMSGSAAAYGKIVLVNNISSAKKTSEIYKLMTEDSDTIPEGSEITFCLEIYNGETWAPASGVKYITFDGYTGDYDTADCEVTSGVLETGFDGKITLVAGENGYPYIRFTEDTVYANIPNDEATAGDIRIVEVSMDDVWGHLSGYDAEDWDNGPALNITFADTFVNANDDGLVFEVEKEMLEGDANEEFTFTVKQVISTTASPITSMDEILDTAPGAELYYIVYDIETGDMVSDGYTDANGTFTIKAGQYVKVYAPKDTVWYVYENTNPGYPLYGVTANDDPNGGDWGYADNASIVDDVNGVVQNTTDATIKPPTAFAIYSANDHSLTFYAARKVPRVGDTYYGKIVTAVYTGFDKDIYSSVLDPSTAPPWYSDRESFTSVVFDESFACIKPLATAYWFYHFTNCVEMDLTFLDTSEATTMKDMFYDCSSLTALDVSNFDTANVTNMQSMFSSCDSLTTLDVSGFDTANVTDMSFMFSTNTGGRLATLDVSDFDTSNVTAMNSMFFGCRYLTALDLSNFDTANVTRMDYMFSNCRGLTTLDVSKFDTANVTGMQSMFYLCEGLTTLDVSGFDTSNVTSMERMFDNCSSLTTLDVSGFDTANVTNMNYMFNCCSSLTALDVSGFDTAEVTCMKCMFHQCSNLTALDVSAFDTANVTDMWHMFSYCGSLTTLDVSGFDTANVTDMSQMFHSCSNLITIYSDDRNFSTSALTSGADMFTDCSKLVGGNGTTYSSSNTSYTMAHVDTESNPGYFTDVTDKP